MTEPAKLLKDVKNYLDITWKDEDTDSKITGIIARGMSYLNDVNGKKNNFEEEGKAKELLLEYCLYARSMALAEFQTNYLSELLTFQIGGLKNEDSDV